MTLLGIDLMDGHIWLLLDTGEDEVQLAVQVDFEGEEPTIYPPDASPASMWCLEGDNKYAVIDAIEKASRATPVDGLRVYRVRAPVAIRKAG